LDSFLIHNQHAASDTSNITEMVSMQLERFAIANVTRENDKAQNKFYLLSMAGYAPGVLVSILMNV